MSEQVFKINQTVRIINMNRFARSYQDYLNGKTHFAEVSGEDLLFQAFETHPLKGYEAPTWPCASATVPNSAAR